MANGFFNEYPYTDNHELNLDWILTKINDFDTRIETLQDTIEANLKVYVDDSLVATVAQIEQTRQQILTDFETFKSEVNLQIAELNESYIRFVVTINNRLNITDVKIQALNDLVESFLPISQEYTNQAILNNNEYIISETTKALETVTVLNYFTGARVSIQAMFDYLAQFHLTNAITYGTLRDRQKTYDELSALNITYTELAVNGGNLIQ